MPVVAGATISGLDHIVELVWDPVPQATVYVIEDRRDGQVFQTEIAETRVDVSEPGVHCIGIRSKNSAGVSGTPPCRGLMLVDMRDVIEALFFSAGPYRETEGGVLASIDRMIGWPSGATVPVIVGANVPSVQHAITSRVTEQFVRASGSYSMPVIPSPIIEPPPFRAGRIRVINPPAEQRGVLCPNTVGGRVLEGCARYGAPNSTIDTAMVVLWANTPYLAGHEIAHTFGMAHVVLPTRGLPPTGTPGLLMQSPRPVPEPQ